MKKLLVLLPFLVVTSCTHKNMGPNIKKLRVRLPYDVPTLDHTLSIDSGSRDIIETLNDGLIRIDKDNKLAPSLAESWQVSDNHKTFSFKLRENLKWSDGQKIVAQQFVDAAERALTPSTGALASSFLTPIVGAEEFYRGKSKDFSTVAIKALDERTIEIKLGKSLPFWINVVAYPVLFPIRKEVIAKYGDKWVTPAHYVSTGAYRLKEWNAQSGKILCEKNPLYWNPSATNGAFEQIEFRVVLEGTTAVNLYQQGDFDIVQGVPADQILQLEKTEPGLLDLKTLFVIGIGMSVEHPLTKNPNVRRALAMAIDRSLLTKFLPKGSSKIDSWIPAELTGSLGGNSLPFDPVQAKKLWAEIPNAPKKIEYLVPSGPRSKMTTEFIQSQLKQNLGIELDIVAQEWKVFLKTRTQGLYPLFQRAWVADFPDAINFLELFACHNEQNDTHMCDPHYDELLEKSAVAKNDAERLKLYDEAEKIILQKNAIVIPLTREDLPYLVHPRIKNFSINGTSQFHLADLRLAN